MLTYKINKNTTMKKKALLTIIFLFYITYTFSQKSGKYDSNLVLTNSRTLILARPGSYYSQITYSLQPEVAASREREYYNISFDLTPNEKGKKPFSSMVVGRSSRDSDIWSFRIQHFQFSITNNADGSLHYTYTLFVDGVYGNDYGINQRFIGEVNDAVGCRISNLNITYKLDQISNGNLIVNKNIGVNGRIGIGVEFPSTPLDVAGTIRAKEVKIEATGWADFVFKKEYQLPTLSEVENHIKEYKHLPDIPSESEVLRDGVSVGEMQTKLLQKIEELTLYIINQEKRIIDLEKQLNSQD